MAQASPGTLRTGSRGTGRHRVDPILSRSLALAGFGLGLMALGRALLRELEGGRQLSQWTIRELLALL